MVKNPPTSNLFPQTTWTFWLPSILFDFGLFSNVFERVKVDVSNLKNIRDKKQFAGGALILFLFFFKIQNIHVFTFWKHSKTSLNQGVPIEFWKKKFLLADFFSIFQRLSNSDPLPPPFVFVRLTKIHDFLICTKCCFVPVEFIWSYFEFWNNVSVDLDNFESKKSIPKIVILSLITIKISFKRHEHFFWREWVIQVVYSIFERLGKLNQENVCYRIASE